MSLLAGWTRRALELVPSGELVRADPTTSPWRRFLPIVRPHWKMLLEVLLGSLLLSLLGLGTPLFTQTIVDRVLVTGSTGLLDMLLAGMILVTLLQAAVRGVRQLILVHVATRCDARLLGDFFRHVFRLPLRFFERRRVGDVVSRVGANEEIRQAMTSTLPAALLDAILATGYLAILLSYRIGLTGLVLATLPAFLLLSCIFTPLLRRSQKEQFARHTEASTWVIESVGGMATVKSMAAEQHVRQRVESLFTEWLVAARRGAHLSAGYSSLASLVQTAASIVLLWYGAHEVIAGQLTAGQLLAFAAIAGNVTTPILGLVGAWDRLQEARNAAERLGDIFETEPEEAAPASLLSPERFEGRLRFEGVEFSYEADGARPVLRGIDVDIRAGETVAVVGRSGSGKSTLLKLALGLHRPGKGRILIDGQDLRSLSLAAVRRRAGVVPQDVFLFSGTIRENIAFADPDVPFSAIVAAAELAGAHELISRLGMGYESEVGERGLSLSGGQRQRIALARALVRDPDILFLDEATSALDSVSEEAIRASLRRIAAGRTTIIIAHRLSTVRDADRILVLDEGRVVEEGRHDDLVRAGGLYAALAGAQLSQ